MGHSLTLTQLHELGIIWNLEDARADYEGSYHIMSPHEYPPCAPSASAVRRPQLQWPWSALAVGRLEIELEHRVQRNAVLEHVRRCA